MFYRRKLLLAILEKSKDTRIDKLKLKQVLFLICKKQIKPCYDFIAHFNDIFSFQLEKDLEVLKNFYSVITNKKNDWVLTKNQDFFNKLKSDDQEIIYSFLKDLEKIEQLFLKESNKKNNKNNRDKQVFSIGYEGISIDYYLDQLVKNNVDLLCDVRKNPLSMKYGFSKNQLLNYCKKLNIEYIHLSDFGIESKLRKNLKNSEDYKKLFNDYENTLTEKSFFKIKDLIDANNRVAFTCFEKNHLNCHRNTLLNFYEKVIGKINPVHLC